MQIGNGQADLVLHDSSTTAVGVRRLRSRELACDWLALAEMIFLAEFKHQAAPLLRGACVPKAFAVLAAVDEVWDFIGKKEKRVRPKDDQNLSDCYTFVAIEQHSKLGTESRHGEARQSDHGHLSKASATVSDYEAMVSRPTKLPYRTPSEIALIFAMLIKVASAFRWTTSRPQPPKGNPGTLPPKFSP